MKILIYENSSGFSSYTSKLAEALMNCSNDIIIDCLTTENNSYIKNINNIHIIPLLKEFNPHIRKNSFRWIINRIYVSFYNIYQRKKYCKRNKYDVISIQSTIPRIDRFFIKSFCRNNNNVVYTVHDVIPPIKSFFWNTMSLKKMYMTIPQLIVHSENNKNQLIKEFNINSNKISVIHHGTDASYRALDKNICKKQLGLNVDKKTILFYGLIREQKGLDILLNAIKGMENVQLFIAGAMPFGEKFDYYDNIIVDYNLDVVKMVRFVPEDMTDTIFNACDIVCLPYKYFYSQSGVFMQALKYRKPVIVSDVSSFREYLSNYNIGILCEPNNIDDLAKKISQIIHILSVNPNYYLEELNKAAKDNSWDASATQYMEVFNG